MEGLRAGDPENLARYHLLGRLGSGGMGVVYLAEDVDGNKVAIKLIRPELAEDPGFRRRFQREVEAGRRVGGICTARYLDSNFDGPQPFLVTEFVKGGNLAEYVAEHGPLRGEQLFGLAVGLAQAIVAMHAAGITHRDLKPTNVLMGDRSPKGNCSRVRRALGDPVS